MEAQRASEVFEFMMIKRIKRNKFQSQIKDSEASELLSSLSAEKHSSIVQHRREQQLDSIFFLNVRKHTKQLWNEMSTQSRNNYNKDEAIKRRRKRRNNNKKSFQIVCASQRSPWEISTLLLLCIGAGFLWLWYLRRLFKWDREK